VIDLCLYKENKRVDKLLIFNPPKLNKTW